MWRKSGSTSGRLSRLLGVTEVDLYVEEVTGTDKTLDVVVNIFNRVNSGGTKLSKGDLALAKICSDWPDARDTMKAKLKEWGKADFHFNLDWLLRSVNTALTGEAKFQFLHDKSAEEIQNGLKRASKHIDTSLNLISGRLGLDHDQVFFGRFAVPVMVRYLDQRSGRLGEKERDKLLFWFVQAGMWGRFSGSTETYIDQDLAALEGEDGSLDKLLDQLRLWHGGLRIEPGHFTGWSLGARFYPVLYLLTRMGGARDWGTGLPLKANLLGKMSRLEVHHIFPKAQLYKHKYKRPEVNALGNFCFLTKDTNLNISDRLPEQYFPEVEKAHPGALASQWIPTEPALWKIENYRDFLEARKALLAAEANQRMEELLHGETAGSRARLPSPSRTAVRGGITSEAEEEAWKSSTTGSRPRACPAASWPMISPMPRADSRRPYSTRLAEWDSGGAEPAGGRPAQRNGRDRVHRQPGRFPLLHGGRRFPEICSEGDPEPGGRLMSTVGQIERKTQARVVKLFRDTLGYDYLGNWEEREGNACIETGLLSAWLKKQGVDDALVTRALHQLSKAAGDTSKSLYDRNRAVYDLLRYGVKVKPDVGENTQTVWLIDWKNPENNHFAIAEEVTVAGADAKAYTKRPDVVLYVNGIALGVLELKRSTVSVAEGIRQNLDNQKKEFIEPFFATMQLVMAGNDTEGLRYGDDRDAGEVLPDLEGRQPGREPARSGADSSSAARPASWS